jgi:hypothetical protein
MAEALTKEPEDLACEPMIVVKPQEPNGHLIDYPLINAQDPDLYCWLPTAAELDGLRPGMSVKIGLSSKLLYEPRALLGRDRRAAWFARLHRQGLERPPAGLRSSARRPSGVLPAPRPRNLRIVMTQRVPIYFADRVYGTVPASFDPFNIRSKTWLYDPRPGDFIRHQDGWRAAPMMGPGDIEAVEGFVLGDGVE